MTAHPLTPSGRKTDLEGDRIADLRSVDGVLISLYAARPSPGGFGALLSELLKPIRDRADNLDRNLRKAIRSDTDHIHSLADELELESAPGYAIFASDLDDVFVLEPLSHPVPDVATIGPRPYMRPLRAAPRALRSGILVADTTTARTFVAVEGIVDELTAPVSADVGSRNWGGFSGYDEHTSRSRMEEVSQRVWREAGERLLERHQEMSFDYLAIGGHDETIDEVVRNLHPYLTRLQRQTFTASPASLTMPTLRAKVGEMDRLVRQQRQAALSGRVCDTAWSGGNAVLGLQDAINAVNAQAIDTLVVAGPFSRPGTICNSCGYLSRTDSVCPVCRSSMFAVDDVVAAVMDATVAAGGTVVQTRVASPLDREGVGALTRFPVGVGA